MQPGSNSGDFGDFGGDFKGGDFSGGDFWEDFSGDDFGKDFGGDDFGTDFSGGDDFGTDFNGDDYVPPVDDFAWDDFGDFTADDFLKTDDADVAIVGLQGHSQFFAWKVNCLTSNFIRVVFSVIMKLSGISDTEFKANPQNEVALLTTIAEAMGISIKNLMDFFDTSADDGATGRKLTVSAAKHLRTLSGPAINVGFTVDAITNLSADELTAALAASIANGQFATNLAKNCALFGASSSLATATATAPSLASNAPTQSPNVGGSSVTPTFKPSMTPSTVMPTQPTYPPTENPTEAPTNSTSSTSSSTTAVLSTGAIIGIAVGGGVFILICIVGAVMMMNKNKQSKVASIG